MHSANQYKVRKYPCGYLPSVVILVVVLFVLSKLYPCDVKTASEILLPHVICKLNHE